ncbi:MAG TPA: regulatory iron-sulfur-containing complex subunit RicT [Gemmatimonadaceae bacterium]|nr:regulatory iron-sulfur-containing complex subunit RicT [Gemmatimonadaceae bacterium]
MPHIIEVAFKGNRKEFFLWEADALPPLKRSVVVEADRGEDLGYVHSTGELALRRNAGTAHGTGDALPTRKARRLASPEEEQHLTEVRAEDDEARRKAMERVRANQLAMKLSDAEWQWDRKKLTLYFTAEKRVDFRNLVRELAAMFRTRIELKQIGVRDEARRLDGIGRCGRQYCSSSWLPELRPVNLGVAKDQRLSLNPSQISGACGRLMCCLRYEHEFYVQQRKRFPKEGRVVRTARGEEKVVANDIFRERVTLRGADGEVRLIALGDLRAEMAQASGEGEIPVADTPVSTESQVELAEDEQLEEEIPVRAAARSVARPPAARHREPTRSTARETRRPARPESSRRTAVGESIAPATSTVGSVPDVGAAMESPATILAGPEPSADGVGHGSSAGSQADQRKSHKRRGRRGGRRNRAREGGGGDGEPGKEN